MKTSSKQKPKPAKLTKSAKSSKLSKSAKLTKTTSPKKANQKSIVIQEAAKKSITLSKSKLLKKNGQVTKKNVMPRIQERYEIITIDTPPRGKKLLNKAQEQELKKLRKAKVSVKELCKKFNISPATFYNYQNR